MCMPCDMPCTPDSCIPAKPPPLPLAAAPTFSPAPGKYAGPQSVAIHAAPGATIHYTTTGAAPSASSPTYSGPVTVSSTTWLQAFASEPGKRNSPVTSGTYTIAPPPPPPPPPPPAEQPRVHVTKERLELKDKIYFAFGKATIKPVSYSLLDEVAATLKDHPEVKHVVIEGNTDNVGGMAYNQKLSEARANAVRDYLVQKGGIAPARLEAKGFGSTRPVASNKTAKGREENRRVDFVIPPG